MDINKQKLFKGFLPNCFLTLALLLIVVVWYKNTVLPGSFFGISSNTWFVFAISIPVVHQFYVWFCWRIELYYKKISSTLGRQRGFSYYAAGFAILIILRLLTIIALAISNQKTLSLNPIIAAIIGIIFLIPSLYLIYSIARYFGFRRAFGIDHFDESYRNAPLVKKGIFRFSNNAMYIYGFLLLWVPGLFLLSSAALVAALFNHLYIWVHYYCTELPDMRFIYGEGKK
ncbi:MAG: phosphatidylethanolamine N-methyltransferase family protein [Elusimicrobiota bacterium]|jgi:protein-S-isoprenylcysteine O-methyltransferase Ste14|nr:phosphatidylethanolamine N-methyltransferase family protein [Elusimicrobiota bacterium]